MTLKIALADDEPLARRRLSRLLREAGCEVVAELPGSAEVIEWFESGQTADALFLDIQMPGLTGLEVLAELQDPPPVVFVTAHVQYAVQAFESAAVDYILKPATEDRIAKTLERLRQNQIPKRKGPEIAALLPSNTLRFPVKAGDGFVFLDFKKVSHFEVEDEIVFAWAGDRYKTSWESLSDVENNFEGEDLIRIQRHLLLRPSAVQGFKPIFGGRGEVRVLGGKDLQVSRSSVPRLKSVLGLLNKEEHAQV